MKLIHVLGALPFLGILGGIIFANRVEPFVLGLPFILFWTVTWVVLTSVIMAVVYVLDPANSGEQLSYQDGRRGRSSRRRRRRDVPYRHGAHAAHYLPFSGLHRRHQRRRHSSARERRRPRCRQPRYPHHDDHGQGRGIPRSRSESFAPRTFVTWPTTASFKKSHGLVLPVRERETRA